MFESDNKYLQRDPKTSALINRDAYQLQQYKQRKREIQETKNLKLRVEELEKKVEFLMNKDHMNG